MRSAYQRVLFWMTFTAVWLHTSEAWAEMYSHFAQGHRGPAEVGHMILIVLITVHLWFDAQNH